MQLPLIKALVALISASTIAIGVALAPRPVHDHRPRSAATTAPAHSLRSDAMRFLAQLAQGRVRPDPALKDNWRGDVTAVAQSLGISDAELARELGRGRSLTQIAAQHGVDPATPRAVLLRRLREGLQRARRDQSVSPTAANALLDALTSALGRS